MTEPKKARVVRNGVRRRNPSVPDAPDYRSVSYNPHLSEKLRASAGDRRPTGGRRIHPDVDSCLLSLIGRINDINALCSISHGASDTRYHHIVDALVDTRPITRSRFTGEGGAPKGSAGRFSGLRKIFSRSNRGAKGRIHTQRKLFDTSDLSAWC